MQPDDNDSGSPELASAPRADPDTDIAAMLRELSALAMDDERPPPGRPAESRPVAQATPAAPASPRRKSLFGRV